MLYYLAMNTKKEILEKIDHVTEARPFSIHQTYVDGENTNALYLHCHSEAEFFYVEEGQMTFHVENQSFDLEAGDAMFVPPNLVHHADKEKGMACKYSAVVFSLEWLSGYSGGDGNLYVNTMADCSHDFIRRFQKGDQSNAELLARLSKFHGYMDLPIQTYEMRLLGELMINVQEIYNAVSKEKSYRRRLDSSRVAIQKGIDYMMCHFDEEIKLEELVESSGYSESHFCHRFKAITGHTPVTYLNRVRVIKAAELLVTTNEKITNIASKCGFDNISYFNRVFRKQMKMSPGQYRNKKS